MSTTPTPEAPSPELIRMHNAGQLLANCAFNIAQHVGEPVSGSVAATLKQCQSEWDAACLAFKAARAALTQGARAVEPVAHLWRNVIDGRTRVVMPDSIITADASWVVEDSLHTATQLQQAVAREREECIALCLKLGAETLAKQEGPPEALDNVMLRQVALLGHQACAAAILLKGTQQ